MGCGSQNLLVVVSLFDNCGGLEEDVLTLDKEIQYNSWVFQLIDRELHPQGFVVEPEKINKTIPAKCCEFSTSKPDCVIYHPNSLFVNKNLLAFVITIHDTDSEDSDVNIDDIDEIPRVDVNGCAVEMKSTSVNEAAINECAYNMFGAGTRLMTMALQVGKLVEVVNMYGLVAAMDNLSQARILKLTLDFKNATCDYRITGMKYNFVEGVNMNCHGG